MGRILRGTTLAVLLVLAALPGAAGAAGPARSAAAMGGGTVTVSVIAGVYRLTLVIGPMQPMYTQADYKRLHPRRGEIMLRGTMMGGMGMHMPNRHLELHVLDRRTMRAVSNAMVTISYQPVVPMGAMAIRPQNVPAVLMVGIGMGMGDVHYGNNVYMPAGSYHVWVHVNGNQAYATYLVRLM